MHITPYFFKGTSRARRRKQYTKRQESIRTQEIFQTYFRIPKVKLVRLDSVFTFL